MKLHIELPSDFGRARAVIVHDQPIAPRRGFAVKEVEISADCDASDVFRALGGTTARLHEVEGALRSAVALRARGVATETATTVMPFAWFDEAQDDLERVPLTKRAGTRRDHLRQYFRIVRLLSDEFALDCRPLEHMRQAVRFSRTHPPSEREKQRRRPRGSRASGHSQFTRP